ncbi:SRPBCC family protein [Ferrimonas sp. SCSIO 43195]|uniref:SRPBCC family protein n=1 Tax=Ferrimonas sp. SCSIO 43195 TaxID=2822844 RepID=UPI002074FC7C|nr:SRPBCC family protein [Ferrimonas sp. SCSIO 43195]USD36003.1 SRPBCC family protein [Ferrimonas sp. SCSIO 43195]
MMKYQHTVTLNADIQTVCRLFSDHQSLTHWQPELHEVTPLIGIPGEQGATCFMEYQLGLCQFLVLKTIVDNHPPKKFVATYQIYNIWNQKESHFVHLDDHTTRWVLISEFRFNGIMKIVGFFFPLLFRYTTTRYMKQFQQYIDQKNGASASASMSSQNSK